MTSRILVPFDGSDPSTAALKFALTHFSEAEIVVLYVVEPFADHIDAGSETERDRWIDRAQSLADECLATVSTILDASDADPVSVETDWRYGRPAHEIIQYASEQEIDHIIMGSHGRTGPSRLLLGSIAETTVRRAPIPVTVVRSDSGDTR